MIKNFKKYTLSEDSKPWDFFNNLITLLNANSRETDDRLNNLEIKRLTGVATLVAGSVVVFLPQVTNRSRIFLTRQNNSGTVGFIGVSSRTEGTSFTISSSSALDTSNVAWELVEP